MSEFIHVYTENDRNTEMYFLFKEGKTLQTIGDKFSLTRERVRQIIFKILKSELLHKLVKKEILFDPPLTTSVYEFINSKEGKAYIREEIMKIFYQRRKGLVDRKLEISKEKNIKPEHFSSIIEYSKAIGAAAKNLEIFHPEIISEIKRNITTGQGGRKWSRYYLKCRMCGTSSSRHRVRGYCVKCYTKTEDFKDVQRASYLRNKEKRVLKTLEYQKKYADKKYFGGNRISALEKVDYKCQKCGLTEQDSIAKSRWKLKVVHIDNLADNSVSNLAVLCLSCCMKYIRFKKNVPGKEGRLLFFI